MDDIYFADPQYATYEDIVANGKGLFRDFFLNVKSLEIDTPEVWSHLVEVPGRNGPIDLTDFAGRPAFKARQIRIGLDKLEDYESWISACTDMVNFLHGKRFNILVMPDVDHCFVGRCNFSFAKENDVITDVLLSVDCDPMRMVLPSLAAMYTDFETGLITGQTYSIETRFGQYANTLRVVSEPVTGASTAMRIWKGNVSAYYNISNSPFTLDTLPYVGDVRLQLFNVAKFSLFLDNKEL